MSSVFSEWRLLYQLSDGVITQECETGVYFVTVTVNNHLSLQSSLPNVTCRNKPDTCFGLERTTTFCGSGRAGAGNEEGNNDTAAFKHGSYQIR